MSRFTMILNYDKGTGFSSFINSFLAIKKIIPDISDEVKNLFGNLDSDSQFNVLLEDFFNKDSFDDTLFKKWVDGLKDTEIASMTAGEALEKYKAHLQDASQQTTLFARRLSTLKTIGGILVSTFANMAFMWAATAVIQGVITVIDNAIHRLEELIEKGEEARQTISEIGDSYNENKTLYELYYN